MMNPYRAKGDCAKGPSIWGDKIEKYQITQICQEDMGIIMGVISPEGQFKTFVPAEFSWGVLFKSREGAENSLQQKEEN